MSFIDSNGGDISQKTLVFLHIAKAGGTTLQRIIRRQYPKSDRLIIKSKYSRIDVNNNGNYERKKGDRLLQVSVQAAMKAQEEFSERESCDRIRYRYIAGHPTFGIHRFIDKPTTYMTVLREPVSRLISHYNYVRQQEDHYLHDEVVSNKMKLEDYTESSMSWELDNGQCRAIASVIDIEALQWPANSRLIDTAKRALDEYFAAVGCVEQFDSSLLLFCRVFGWKRIWYKRENVGASKNHNQHVSRDIKDNIRKINKYDVECYEYVKRRLIKDLETNGVNSGTVNRFRTVNNIIGTIYGIPHSKNLEPIKKKVKRFMMR